MILDENYAILDEDEDIELLDEDYDDEDDILLEGDILDEEDEILCEGEISILDEEMILLESPITSSSSVDTSASQKSIAKAKSAIDVKIASGKYRAYKSSDKAVLEKAIKNKNLLKIAGASIAGAGIGAITGVGAGLGTKHAVNAVGNSKKANAVRDARRKDAKSAFSGKEFNDYQKQHGVQKKKLFKKEECDIILEEALDMYLQESFDYVLFNEAKSADKNLHSKQKLNKRDAKYAGIGAGAGATSGALLAKKILSSMKYTVFTMNGLTILSLYSTSKEGEAKGKSVCYAIATAVDGSKIYMHKVNLKSK